jgi:hypothetical protein
MEKSIYDENSSKDLVEITGVDSKKDSNMIKGIVIGASVVAAAWLGIGLYKKLKKRTPRQIAPEVDVVE